MVSAASHPPLQKSQERGTHSFETGNAKRGERAGHPSSVTSISNSTGAVAQTYAYDSFGKPTASTGTLSNPFQYTGREFDAETGIYYYRARYFDPSAGRFLSEDALRFQAEANFYRYVWNSPVGWIDPSGNDSCFVRTLNSFTQVPCTPPPGGMSCIDVPGGQSCVKKAPLGPPPAPLYGPGCICDSNTFASKMRDLIQEERDANDALLPGIAKKSGGLFMLEKLLEELGQRH